MRVKHVVRPPLRNYSRGVHCMQGSGHRVQGGTRVSQSLAALSGALISLGWLVLEGTHSDTLRVLTALPEGSPWPQLIVLGHSVATQTGWEGRGEGIT